MCVLCIAALVRLGFLVVAVAKARRSGGDGRGNGNACGNRIWCHGKSPDKSIFFEEDRSWYSTFYIHTLTTLQFIWATFLVQVAFSILLTSHASVIVFRAQNAGGCSVVLARLIGDSN